MPTYSYQVQPYDVTVSMTAANSNTFAPITYQGRPGAKGMVRSMLDGAYGAFGHLFDPDTSTPTDLDAALNSTFGRENVQRTGAAPSYDPGIPKNAVT